MRVRVRAGRAPGGRTSWLQVQARVVEQLLPGLVDPAPRSRKLFLAEELELQPPPEGPWEGLAQESRRLYLLARDHVAVKS